MQGPPLTHPAPPFPQIAPFLLKLEASNLDQGLMSFSLCPLVFRNNINIDDVMPYGDPVLAGQSIIEEAYRSCPSHFDVDGPLIPSED